MTVKMPNIKTPCIHEAATISLITVKSCNALLLIILICIPSYLKSVLRYKFLILDTYRPDILYLREEGGRIRGCFRYQEARASDKVWETLLQATNG